MSDLLRREMAPVPGQAWKQIDETASRVLKANLSARAFVDIDGPHGWEFAGLNTGRYEVLEDAGAVPCAVRQTLPAVEVRVPIHLERPNIDDAARGCEDIDLESVEKAARDVAAFEESAIYNGFEPACIQGILVQAEGPPVSLPGNVAEFPGAVAEAVQRLRAAGQAGPYHLVLGDEAWKALMPSGSGGYPPHRIVKNLIGGDILSSSAFKGGVVVAQTEGAFQLAVGQDLSIGYFAHDNKTVELFLTESFTFRVLDPSAVVRLTPGD